jgi:hypothetical protein
MRHRAARCCGRDEVLVANALDRGNRRRSRLEIVTDADEVDDPGDTFERRDERVRLRQVAGDDLAARRRTRSSPRSSSGPSRASRTIRAPG